MSKDPASSQPSEFDSSEYGAGGPSSSSPCWPISAMPVATNGDSAMQRP